MQEENSRTEQFVSQHVDAIRQRIASAIEKRRGVQARVSRETGIGRGHLSQLLSGKNTLRLRYVLMIGDALGLNIRWLLTGEGHMADVDPAPAPGVGTGSEAALATVAVALARAQDDVRELRAKVQALQEAAAELPAGWVDLDPAERQALAETIRRAAERQRAKSSAGRIQVTLKAP